MGKISVVINTLNEEKNIRDAISCVKKLADEVIVVDMQSDDQTKEIAKKQGAKVFNHKRTGYVEPARNFAIEKSTKEWIFILDADERIDKQLTEKLKKIASDKKSADYYRLPRKNIIFGKWIKHSRWWPDYNIRFFRKGSVSWSEVIHSVPMTKGKGLDLPAKEINAIVHNNYQSIEQFIERLNRYTTIQAKVKVEGDYQFRVSDVIKKPATEFIGRYFQGRGYKDGLHGLALAILQAFSEAVVYLKVWQMNGFKEKEAKVKDVIKEMKKAETDIHYWQADALLREKGGMINRVKRKLKI